MSDLTHEQKKEFIEAAYNAALGLAAEGRAIVPAVVAAQAALESRYGASSLSAQAYNYFGIKAGKSWRGRSVVMPTMEWDRDLKKMVATTARFKAFGSMRECFADYARIIETYSWFRDCVEAAKTQDPIRFVEGLITKPGEPGWATDPKYADKVLKVIAMWGLLNR